MTLIIIIFGLLTSVAGILILINPETVFAPLRNNVEKPWLHVTAIVVRLILGVLLILYADVSRFPLIILIIGYLSIAAAGVFSIIGRQRFIRLMRWAFSFLQPWGRVGGLFAALFGGFLVYAFI